MYNQSLLDTTQIVNIEHLTVTEKLHAVSLPEIVVIGGGWCLLVWLLYRLKKGKLHIEGLTKTKKENLEKFLEIFVIWVYPIAVIAAIGLRIFAFVQANGG